MGTQLAQANVMGGVVVNRASADDTTITITKAQIEAGNRFLYVVTDTSVNVTLGTEVYLAVPAYPLIVALNSGHYDAEVTYAALV